MMKLFFTAVCLLFSASSFAQPVNAPLSQENVALLDSVMRNCGGTRGYRGDFITNFDGAKQLAAASIGSSDEFTHYYSPQMWNAIEAAAKRFQQLGWVVTDKYYSNARLNDRVMTKEQFQEIWNADEKHICVFETEIPTCDDSERRIARELFGIEDLTPCGDEMPWEKDHPNALRNQHVRMIQTLIDNGYTYNEATRSFDKAIESGPAPESAQGQR
jgi:hypothetical protein